MSHSARQYLQHIRDETQFLLTSAQDLTEERFLNDEVRKRAFVRSLEIIGEAVKKLPLNLREQYPQIPWRNIAGMRDRLIHDYMSIDYEIVWGIITVQIPVFAEMVKLMLSRDDL